MKNKDNLEKQKKSESVNQPNTNKNKFDNFISVQKNVLKIPILLSCVLAICNFGVVVFKLVFQKDISFNDLLNTDVITLIGIAVSVWISITIFNSVENSKIKSVEDTLNSIENTRNDLTIKNRKLKKQIQVLQFQQYEINKNLFAAEVKKSDDLFVNYILNNLNNSNNLNNLNNLEYVSAQDYFILYSIEKKFADIVFVHNSFNYTAKQKQEIYDSIKAYIEKEKGSINKRNREINSYFEYRLGDFFFYSGYLYGQTADYINQYNYFYNAVQQYIKAFNIIKLMNSENSCIVELTNKQLAVYLNNMLGECYSKQVEALVRMDSDSRPKNIKYEDIKEKAKKYCSESVDIMEQYAHNGETIEKETYYRNYGWAIIRSLDFDKNVSDEISQSIELFKKAFNLNKEKYKIYNALICSHLLLISNYIDSKICHSIQSLEPLSSDVDLKNIKGKDKNKCNELYKNISEFIKMAKIKFPEKGDILLYEACSLLLLIYAHLKLPCAEKTCIKTIKNNLTNVPLYTEYNEKLFDVTVALKGIIFPPNDTPPSGPPPSGPNEARNDFSTTTPNK